MDKFCYGERLNLANLLNLKDNCQCKCFLHSHLEVSTFVWFPARQSRLPGVHGSVYA